MRSVVLLALAIAIVTPAPVADASVPVTIRIDDVAYPTLQAALDAARPGDRILVVGGVHPGPLDVNTSVTLEGRDRPVIAGGGYGTVVTMRAENVTISGFRVEGSGDRHDKGDAGIAVLAANATVRDNELVRNLFGVWVAQAAHARIENNTVRGDTAYDEARRGDGIRLWYSPYAIVRNNTLEGTRDLIGWYARDLTIEDNTITRARYGLHLMYCSDVRIHRNTIRESSVGVYTMSSARVDIAENHVHASRGTSGYALAFKDADDVLVQRNILSDNAVGLYLDTTPFSPDGDARFTANILATNDVGVLILPAVSRNELADNTFWDNREHVRIHGGHATGANTWQGNHWSGFVGYDANGDGYSETPYRAQRLFERMQDGDARLRALDHTLLANALDAGATAFPLVRPEPKLEDPRPRIAPGPVPFTPATFVEQDEADLASAIALAGVIFALLPLLPRSPRRILMNDTPREQPALVVRGLHAGYGKTVVLTDVDLELRPGEAVALWGGNGAGKTTLLKAILGLIPHAGTVEIVGASTRRDPRRARGRIGYVPQEIHLGSATVHEVMRTYADLRGARRDDADRLVDRFGLRDHVDKRASELSGGLRQRLGLALALLNDPAVLLLDEPTANLDAETRRQYLDELRRLASEGKAILFTSHREDEVGALAARVMLIERAGQEAVQTESFLAARRMETVA